MWKMIEPEDREGYETGELEFILLPSQIPQFWESIKYAYVQSGAYKEEHIPALLNRLLVNLLDSSYVCGVTLTYERKLESVVILNVVEEEITNDRSLFIDAVYSFLPADKDKWDKKIIRCIEYAKMQDCKRIKGQTGNQKLIDIISKLGVREESRIYSLDL